MSKISFAKAIAAHNAKYGKKSKPKVTKKDASKVPTAKLTIKGVTYTLDAKNGVYKYETYEGLGRQRKKVKKTIAPEQLSTKARRAGDSKAVKAIETASKEIYKDAYDSTGARSYTTKEGPPRATKTKTHVRYKDRASAEAAATSKGSNYYVKEANNGEFQIKKKDDGGFFEKAGKAIEKEVKSAGKSVEKQVVKPIKQGAKTVAKKTDQAVKGVEKTAKGLLTDPIEQIEKAGKGIERETKSALKTTENIVKDTVDVAGGFIEELVKNPELILSGGTGITVAAGRSAQENAGSDISDPLNKLDREVVEPLDKLKDNPLFQASLNFIPGVGPLVAASVSAFSKLDNGQDLTAQDILSIGAGVVSAGASNAYKGVIDAGGTAQEAAAAAEAFRKGSEAAQTLELFKDADTVRKLVEADNSAEFADVLVNSSLGDRTLTKLSNSNVLIKDTIEYGLNVASGKDEKEAFVDAYGPTLFESEQFQDASKQAFLDVGVPEAVINQAYKDGRAGDFFTDVFVDGKEPVKVVADIYNQDIAEALFGEDGNERALTISLLQNQEALRDIDPDDPESAFETLYDSYQSYKDAGGTLSLADFNTNLGNGTGEFSLGFVGDYIGKAKDFVTSLIPDNLLDIDADLSGIRDSLSGFYETFSDSVEAIGGIASTALSTAEKFGDDLGLTEENVKALASNLEQLVDETGLTQENLVNLGNDLEALIDSTGLTRENLASLTGDFEEFVDDFGLTRENLEAGISAVGELASGAYDFAAEQGQAAIDFAAEGLEGVGQRLDEFGNAVATRFDEFGNAVQGKFDEFGNFVEGKFDQFGNFVEGKFDAVAAQFDEFGNYIGDKFSDIDLNFEGIDTKFGSLDTDIAGLNVDLGALAGAFQQEQEQAANARAVQAAKFDPLEEIVLQEYDLNADQDVLGDTLRSLQSIRV